MLSTNEYENNTASTVIFWSKKSTKLYIKQLKWLSLSISITIKSTYTPTKWPFVPDYPGEPGTRKVTPIRILLKQDTVGGIGISWAICQSAPCSRQITMPAPHHSVFYRLDALPATQPTASKHWRHFNIRIDRILFANWENHLWSSVAYTKWVQIKLTCLALIVTYNMIAGRTYVQLQYDTQMYIF